MPILNSERSFSLLFLLMDCFGLIRGQDPHCLTTVTCISHKTRDFVAPCVRNMDGQKAYCDTTALSSYYTYNDCTPTNCEVEEKNHCENNPCKNNGKCNKMFGSYSCTCINSFHGRDCTEILTEGMRTVQGAYFMFSKVTTTRKKNLLYIFIAEAGDDMSILFSAGDSGEITKINKAQMIINKAKQKCQQLKLKEYQCNYLPDGNMLYKSVYFEVVYTLEGSVIMEHYPEENVPVPGFKINLLSVKVYNKISEEFSEVFSQVVSYRNEVCPIQVVITQNCGSRSDKPLQLSRKTQSVISSIIRKSPLTEAGCPNQIVDYKWDIFEIGTQFWTPRLKPKNSTSGVAEYNIEKFTWRYGLYKVKLTVFLSGIINTKEYSTDYSGICYFEVVKVPLEVKIQGGAERTVSHNEYFVLNASQSYDPNELRSNQLHLNWNWKCDRTEEFCKPRSFNNGIYEFPQGLPEGTWIFDLTLKTIDASNTPVTASQTIFSSEVHQVQIDISCLKNCGITDFKTNPKEVVYLEAIATNSVNVLAFQWTFSFDDNLEEYNAEEISQASVKSNVLIIKENVLKAGSKYTFKVKPADLLLRGSSSITINVNKPPEGGSCSVSPLVGQKAITEFSITCADFSNLGNEITQLSYEFYQKANKQEHPGTMLGHSISGELKNVILTQTTIAVRVIGAYGMYTDISLAVKLEEWVPTIQNIEEMLTTLTSMRLAGDSSSSVRIAGAIIDLIKHVPDKLTIIKVVLESLTMGKINDFSDVKMFTSVLKKVVNVGVLQLLNGIDGQVVQSMGMMMALLAESMLNRVINTDKKEVVIIVDDIKSITQTMLECTDAIVNSKDKVIFDPSSSNSAVFASHDLYKKGTTNMVAALFSSGVAILTSLLPHEQEIVLKAEDSMMWLKVEDPEVLTNLSAIPQNDTTNIKITKQLAKVLQARSQNVDVMVTVFNKNPYWWDLQEREIASEIISVNVWDRSRRHKLVTLVSEPLEMFFKLKNTASETISGHVTMPSIKDSEDDKDSSVAVHILEAPPENSNGKLFVEFINLQDNEFRVLIYANLRPDYNLMMNEAQVVSSHFSTLSLSYENISASTLHFIGILPGENVAENQTVSYTFNIYSIQCKLRYLTVWTSPACIIGEDTSKDTVHCKCSHMSFFGSSIFVAPNTIHPIKDLYLLMTLKDNPLVFTIVVSLLILYLILLIWLKVKENRDKLKTKVIVLADNFPGEQYSYLVVVFTSFSFGSGTRSNVGIKILGSKCPSRAHILRSRNRKVFRRNADDWFLLFARKSLGDLRTIHIWHDNSGPSPDWCCRKIHVYDLTTRKRYTFMVEQWLSVRPGEYPEAVIQALGPGEHYGWKQIVVHNLVYHLQENHLWASIFIGHPRATVSKSQRLTVTFCVIFVTFLTGIMFYGVARGQVYEDEPQYTVKYREIIVAIQSTIISAVVSSVVVICFRKSNSLLQPKGENNDIESHLQLNENRNTANNNREYVLLKVIIKALYFIVRGKPLMPILVGVESYESVVRRRKWLRAGWFISQITIWTSAFFIILYGLKLGKVISKLWVSSAILSFAQGIFVNAPLKIIAFSTLLAMMGEMYNVDTYECDIVAATQSEYLGNINVLNKLLIMRTASEYQPLSLKKVNEFRNLYLQQDDVFNKLGFFVTILFLLALMNLTGFLWAESNFYINSHLSISLTRSLRSHEPSLEEVDDVKKLIDFLVITWIPSLFKGKWYNKRMSLTSFEESLPETGWFMDTTHRMIGIPRLRQIRIRDEYCPPFMFHEIILKNYCFPGIKNTTLDTDSYGLKWDPISNYVNKPLLEPWSYQWEEPDGYSMYGQSGVAYHSGGYIVLLKDTQRACASTISDLKNLNWWDIRLRALISEVNLYNPNTNTHTAVTIISEHLPSSAFTNQIKTFTVHMQFNFFQTFFFLCILSFFNVRLLYVINRQGIFEILSNFWGCYDLILVLLGNICIVVHCIKIYECTKTIQAFQESGDNSFFQYYNILFHQRLSEVLWGLLWCFAPIRIMAFKYTLYLCRVSSYTLYRIKWQLTVVSILIMILISAQNRVLNFTLCPENKPLYENRYFISENVSASNYKYSLKLISQMLALTCSCAVMIVQIILIKTYKSTKGTNFIKI